MKHLLTKNSFGILEEEMVQQETIGEDQETNSQKRTNKKQDKRIYKKKPKINKILPTVVRKKASWTTMSKLINENSTI